MEKRTSSTEAPARRQPISEERLGGLAGLAVVAEAAAMAPYEAMMATMGESGVPAADFAETGKAAAEPSYFNDIYLPVSYTHLTLPTICSV